LNQLAEDVHVEIEKFVDFVLVQLLKLDKLLLYLTKRETWQNAIFNLFANRASKFSVTKGVHFPLLIVIAESDLLQMIFSKTFEMGMVLARRYDRPRAGVIVQE
jgi:hypothetical protein